MKPENGQTLLFIGDSITDTGRDRPVGQLEGLGTGYVAMVAALLNANRPDRVLRILNTGISGNRVTDLKARWQTDVLDLKPDWLSVMIGINDVWRQFDCDMHMDQVHIDLFQSTYRSILEQARPSLKGLVLMSPYLLEANPKDPMREKMDEYGKAVAALAAEFDAILVDVQAAFDAYLQHRPTQSLCGDRVHPNNTGHMIIAQAFLNGTGLL